MKKVLILPIFILLLVGFHSQVHAQTATPTFKPRQELRNDVKDFRQAVHQDVKDAMKGSPAPSGAKGKLCELHVGEAKRRVLGLGARGFEMKARLDVIVKAVEEYYTTKLVPQGKTISNYDALVADVNAKKAAMDPLVNKVKADSSSLTCDNDKAPGQFQTFRSDAQALILAFKDYRLSVIALAKAVKTAAAEKVNISPTLTPEVTQ